MESNSGALTELASVSSLSDDCTAHMTLSLPSNGVNLQEAEFYSLRKSEVMLQPQGLPKMLRLDLYSGCVCAIPLGTGSIPFGLKSNRCAEEPACEFL